MAAQSTYRVFRSTGEQRNDHDLYELIGQWTAESSKEAIRLAFSENKAISEGDTVFAISERQGREHTPKTKTVMVWD